MWRLIQDTTNSKLTPGDTAREESEALCAFTLQFTAVDYVKVNIAPFWDPMEIQQRFITL